MIRKPCVLFLCTHNSARSQMAEGWLRHMAGDIFDVYSAGTHPRTVHPLAVRVMDEAGIDISRQTSKGLDGIIGCVPVRYTIIVCPSAARECPSIFPSLLRTLHWPFDDPSAGTADGDEQLVVFRRVRDEIAARLRAWLPEVAPALQP